MKKISEKVYEADEGKIIVSKINNLKYKRIKLSHNDSIKNYKEVSKVSSNSEKTTNSEKPVESEISKKWSRKDD